MRLNLCTLLLLLAALATSGSECGESPPSTIYVGSTSKEPDQVQISLDHRVENRGPRCFWSVMETLARHNKITQLYGLTDKPGYERAPERRDVPAFLKKYRVRYEMQLHRNYDTQILKRGCHQGLGVAICIVFHVNTPHGAKELAHMITLVSYTDNYVRFIDPNKPLKVQQADHEWFRKYWDGWAIILYPNN